MSFKQDWEPVVFRKKKVNAPKKGAPGGTGVRKHTQSNKQTVSDIRIKDEDELPQLKTVSRSLSKQIQDARTTKKLTQKQLAQKINERVQVVQDYESGKAAPTNQILSKLRKALGVNLKK